MSAPCFYHPTTESAASCINCGMPICADCRETVNNKPACKKCIEKIRARVADQMARQAEVNAQIPSGQFGLAPGNDQSAPPQPQYQASYQPTPQAPYQQNGNLNPLGGAPVAAHLGASVIGGPAPAQAHLMAAGIGLGIAIVGGIVYGELNLMAHMTIPFLRWALCLALAYGVVKGARDNGIAAAAICTACAFLLQIIGFVINVDGLVIRDGYPNPGLSVLAHINGTEWFFIAVGCFIAFRMSRRIRA